MRPRTSPRGSRRSEGSAVGTAVQGGRDQQRRRRRARADPERVGRAGLELRGLLLRDAGELEGTLDGVRDLHARRREDLTPLRPSAATPRPSATAVAGSGTTNVSMGPPKPANTGSSTPIRKTSILAKSHVASESGTAVSASEPSSVLPALSSWRSGTVVTFGLESGPLSDATCAATENTSGSGLGAARSSTLISTPSAPGAMS